MEPEGTPKASAPAQDAPRERAAGDEALPRRLRLQQRREFLRVQRSGVKHHTRFFLVFVAPSALRGRGPRSSAAPGLVRNASGLPGTRLGVTVTRKVGKAVKRNRIKRLVREAFRRERHALPPGLDMVWVAKRDAIDTTFDAVVLDMRALAERLTAKRGRTGARAEAGSHAAPPPAPSPSSMVRPR